MMNNNHNNVPQSSLAVSAPIASPHQDTSIDITKLRTITRNKIFAMLVLKVRNQRKHPVAKPDAILLHKQLTENIDAATQNKFRDYAIKLEEMIFKSAGSLAKYSDDATLSRGVDYLLSQLRETRLRKGAAATPTCAAMNGRAAQCIRPTHALHTSRTTNNSFQSGGLVPMINCTSGGVSAGFSVVPDLQRPQSAGANNYNHQMVDVYRPNNYNHQMVDVYRPNMNQFTCGGSSPLITGLEFSRNCVPLAANGPMSTSQELFFNATHLSTLSQPILQPPDDHSHLHRYSMSNNVGSFGPSNPNPYPYPYGAAVSSGSMAVAQNSIPWNPNPMLEGVDATVTSNQSNLQGISLQTPFPKRQLHHPLWNNNFQSAPNNFQMSSNSQELLNHVVHQQDRGIEPLGQHSQKLYPDQLQTQDRLLDNDAYLNQQAMGTLAAPGPSLDSSYKEEARHHREATTNGNKPSKLQCQQTAVKDHYIGAQSASVHGSDEMNSPPSFQQKQQKSTGISENNYNGRQREHTGVVNICPMQPEPVHPFSSPIPPSNTVERERLPDGNGTSSKQVNGDCGQTYINERRWIVFMLHVRKCKARKGKCASSFCFQGKKMWKHIGCCKVPDCTFRYCLSTRKWLHHYNYECVEKSSCRFCEFVKSYYEKNKDTSVPLRRAKCSKRQPKKPSTSSRKANKKGAPSIDADHLQPPMKRLKLQRPSQNATPETGCDVVVCKPDSSMNMQDKDALKSDKTEVMPMDIDVPKTCGIPVTRELEKLVAGDTTKGKNCCGITAEDDKTSCLLAQGKSKCMNEVSASKEENVKQSVDASKTEMSSLVELFTPEQVKGHIRSLRQWEGQSKTKADKNKAMGCSISVNSCQLCAVERLVFEPIPIYCSPCGVRIKKNALHYSVAAGESKHCVCAPCYNEARENLVSLEGTCIPKARLEKKKNDEQVGEGWVQCDKCEAWQHQICALFNSRRNHGEATKYTCPNCYIQEVEQGERRPLPPSAVPGANKLPVSALSNHIEERLFKKLKEERQERATLQGKSFEEVPGAESLTVRVVASVDRVLEVKERFLKIFREDNYPPEFPYKSKVILLFQKIENVEVCLFGMFVQEFGTTSGPPNQRRVYLSYLDSVKYFRPEVRTVSGEALRTFVYHEILIGYLDYCKKRGFTSCYIWACPPLKGEDYILYCHPEIQKTPKTDKLREWYLAMLRKASKEDVVVECTNLYDHFFVQSGECRANVTAARLPYFDGDYWPGAAEDLIRQMSQEDDGTNSNRKGLTKKVISKRALKAFGQLDDLSSVNASKDRLMMQKLGETICPMKEDCIMVHLQHCCKHCSTLMVSGNRWVCNQCKNFQICDKCNEVEQNRLEKERHPIKQKEKHLLFPVAIEDVPTEIKDKDDNLESEFFDNRQAFLNLCQGNNYQYDTLRRAKHSSMMILYHLHNPTAPAFATFCTICQQEVENSQGWYCEVCPSYDVCSACYSKASINHSHKLIRRSSSTGSSLVKHSGKTNQNHQARQEKFKELLLHVIACRSTTLCQYQGCRTMKILFRHSLSCKTVPGACRHCKKFWFILRLHANSCRDSQCTVPKCRDLRAINSRKQQQSEKRRRTAVIEMMRERAAEATRTG